MGDHDFGRVAVSVTTLISFKPHTLHYYEL